MLVETVEKERYIETALDNLFKQELIEEAAVSHLLSLVAQTDDEYQKGMLYTGLVHYKEEISKFSDNAKALIAAHLTAELKRYLNHIYSFLIDEIQICFLFHSAPLVKKAYI